MLANRTTCPALPCREGFGALGMRFWRPDAFGNALGSSLADAMQPETQGQGPWSDADYRNGSDIESDNYSTERARSDALYGLASAGRVRFGGDASSSVTLAQQRALEAGIGPRSQANAQAMSDYGEWLVANTDLRMDLQPRNAGAGRGFINPPLVGASSSPSAFGPRDTDIIGGFFDEGAGSGPVNAEPGSSFGTSKAAKFGRAIANDPMGELRSAAAAPVNWALSTTEGLMRGASFSQAASPEMSLAAALNPRIAADQQSLLGSIDSIRLPRVDYMSGDGLGPFTEGAIDVGLLGSGAFSLFKATGSFSSLSRLPGQTYIAGEGLAIGSKTSGGERVVLDLFGGRTSQVPGAINVDISAQQGVRASALQLPFRSGVADEVIASNPYIPGGSGMMDFLPEAARTLRPGGQLIINATQRNPFGVLPEADALNGLGLRVVQENGSLLPRFENNVFRFTDGRVIPNTSVRTTILEKVGP